MSQQSCQDFNFEYIRGGVKLEFIRNLFDSKICDSIDSKGQKFDEN